MMKESKIMTTTRLKKMFPNYAEEIERLSRSSTCGCSGCVWNVLKQKHPQLTLPKEVCGLTVAWA